MSLSFVVTYVSSRWRLAAFVCGRCLYIVSVTDRDMAPTTSVASYLFGAVRLLFHASPLFWHCRQERVWVISIARLWTLPPLHLQPIDVIVFDDPYMEILS